MTLDLDAMEKRVCTKCGLSKSTADFYRDSSLADGLRKKCKTCSNAQNEAWRRRNHAEILRRKWVSRRRWYAEHPGAKAAHSKLQRALESGRLVKPLLCERDCGRAAEHAHHDDYAKPLEIEWLCVECHWSLSRNPAEETT